MVCPVLLLMTAALVSLLVACSDGLDPLQTWIGRDRAALTQVWGQPSNEVVDGTTWRADYVSYWQDGFSIVQSCQRSFTGDARGIITHYSASGCSH